MMAASSRQALHPPLTPQVPHIRVIKRTKPSPEAERRHYYAKLEKRRRLNNQPSQPYMPPHTKVTKKKRFRSLMGLEADMTPLEKAAKKLRELKPEPLLIQQNRRPCSCAQCVLVRRTNSSLAYHCPVPSCREEFDDYVTLFEHQQDEHGAIDAHCRQLVAELNHQERAVVPYPPSTVYAGEQFLQPAFRPTQWTLMERVESEHQTLFDKLLQRTTVRSAKIVWGSFLAAYTRVQQGGFPELQRQYRVALEYYNSSLKFPVANRTALDIDPCPSVALGRNWLTSSEREDDPLTVEDDDEDEEIVVVDTLKKKSVSIDANADPTPSSSIDKCWHESKALEMDDKDAMKDEGSIFNELE